MTCGKCGFENRADARFCRECGVALALTCPACGIELPAGTKFCDECGAGVTRATFGPTATAAETRKVVTVVFADLRGLDAAAGADGPRVGPPVDGPLLRGDARRGRARTADGS